MTGAKSRLRPKRRPPYPATKAPISRDMAVTRPPATVLRDPGVRIMAMLRRLSAGR
jgi:hypothetical protein